MRRTVLGFFVFVLALARASAGVAQTQPPAQSTAQIEAQGQDPLLDMQLIARALGVSCTYCHVSMGAATNYTSDENPKKGIARLMIAMTRDLNARIQAATGKPAPVAAAVHCATCHRGVPVPQPLMDIMLQTIRDKGAEAAAEQYRDLRKRFYGRDTYDFSEATLLQLCQRLGPSQPDVALTMLQMNLEFNPRSTDSYILMSRAYVRKRDTPTAIEVLKKALEIDPENGVVKGYLYQLEPARR